LYLLVYQICVKMHFRSEVRLGLLKPRQPVSFGSTADLAAHERTSTRRSPTGHPVTILPEGVRTLTACPSRPFDRA